MTIKQQIEQRIRYRSKILQGGKHIKYPVTISLLFRFNVTQMKNSKVLKRLFTVGRITVPSTNTQRL